VEFHRLIRKIDEIAGELDEEVVAQIGFIDEAPKHMKWFQYLSFMEMVRYFKEASIIIGHGGVGTVINVIAYRKPLILVPRSAAHGEHLDDHQLEFARQVEGTKGIFVVDDVEDLKPSILKVRRLIKESAIEAHVPPERDRLISFMKDYVSRIR
jgi:beta-1,4-N-acetylglucosaminyltransferase